MFNFSKDSPETILSYLSHRYQRVKVNTTFSSWTELIRGIPQSSVIEPILFTIYLNDLFFLLNDIDICNYLQLADDTTVYVCNVNLE